MGDVRALASAKVSEDRAATDALGAAWESYAAIFDLCERDPCAANKRARELSFRTFSLLFTGREHP